MTGRSKLLLGINLPALAVCASLGVLLGLGSYTFWYAEGGSYFSGNPQSCVNCHIMRHHYDSWIKASHHAVAVCNDCHTPHQAVDKYLVKAENGFWHSKSFTLQDYQDPLRIRPGNARVVQESCIHCHRDFVSGMLHSGDAHPGEAAGCVRCHAAVGHGPPK